MPNLEKYEVIMSKATKKQLQRDINNLATELTNLKIELLEKKVISDEPKPQLKQLTQSVFDGLDEKWRFAAVDKCGEVWYSTHKTQPSVSGTHLSPEPNADSMQAKDYYDASNWQNSLIERDDIAKELLEVDLSSELTGSELCKAMLAKGDKYVMCMAGDGTDVIYDLACFVSSTHPYIGRLDNYRAVTPINNQGEPLTQAEAGL